MSLFMTELLEKNPPVRIDGILPTVVARPLRAEPSSFPFVDA